MANKIIIILSVMTVFYFYYFFLNSQLSLNMSSTSTARECFNSHSKEAKKWYSSINSSICSQFVMNLRQEKWICQVCYARFGNKFKKVQPIFHSHQPILFLIKRECRQMIQWSIINLLVPLFPWKSNLFPLKPWL